MFTKIQCRPQTQSNGGAPEKIGQLNSFLFETSVQRWQKYERESLKLAKSDTHCNKCHWFLSSRYIHLSEGHSSILTRFWSPYIDGSQDPGKPFPWREGKPYLLENIGRQKLVRGHRVLNCDTFAGKSIPWTSQLRPVLLFVSSIVLHIRRGTIDFLFRFSADSKF